MLWRPCRALQRCAIIIVYSPPPELDPEPLPAEPPTLVPLDPLVDVAREPVVELPLEPTIGALGSIGALLGSVFPPEDGDPVASGITRGAAVPIAGRIFCVFLLPLFWTCRLFMQFATHFSRARCVLRSSNVASR